MRKSRRVGNREIIEVHEAELRAEGKCPSCSERSTTFVCDCAKDCGLWSGCMAAIADEAFARHTPSALPPEAGPEEPGSGS